MPGRAVWIVMLAQGALDVDAAHRCIGQLLAQELADLPVGKQVRWKVPGIRIPTGTPLARDAEADADRVDFLTHVLLRSPVSYRALSATVTLMWLNRLTMRLPRPLARA
jgi:hypothetical protein